MLEAARVPRSPVRDRRTEAAVAALMAPGRSTEEAEEEAEEEEGEDDAEAEE